MKLATFNLYQFAEPGYYWYERDPHCTYTADDWKAKTRWIKQRLREMDADVVGFQEVFSVDALRELCAEAGYTHFASIDTPGTLEQDDKVFDQSVVALASRLPLENPRTVAIHPQVKSELPLPDEFRFSRWPVCADINVADLGTVTVYVVHLKSKRPVSEDIRYENKAEWPFRVRDTMMRLSRGNVASMLQRGAEATLLYHSMCEVLDAHPNRPVAILGDMNDDQDSTPLRALTMSTRIYSIGGVHDEEWPEHTKRLLHDYRLTDSFRVAPNMYRRVRPFTHVYRGHGNSLDHILVSNALNPRNPQAQAEVVHYEVLSEHLDKDGVENQRQSDHGQVFIELLPVAQAAHHPRPAIHSQKDVLTRQDFVDLAGDVYQSRKHFRQWSSEDKWKNFWAFFFDNDHGWVTSIYGRTPVDELYQKKHHSIEHIIPQDFLSRYMTRQRAPRHVRYGASVNPFNFAPSERGLNAKRSNFPFDMDGDNVVRPQYMKLQPERFISTGLDADDEWVIPSQNRGDIARSLLYMLLIYEIDELYNRHVDTLVHWAKIDSPSAWEVAYNDWVYKRLRIRNPFIDDAEKALLLLNNKELMRSIEVRKQ
jgi:endonuclease/exonuclease/phosphatase family metal-dependent hydrolase